MYDATLNGKRVAVKKPILSTSEDINKFHKELQLLWLLTYFFYHASASYTWFTLYGISFLAHLDGITHISHKICFFFFATKGAWQTCWLMCNFFLWLRTWSKLNHYGIAKLVAAHARPPNYMFFFNFYEFGNLSHKLHVEEWSPTIDQSLMITKHLGKKNTGCPLLTYFLQVAIYSFACGVVTECCINTSLFCGFWLHIISMSA